MHLRRFESWSFPFFGWTKPDAKSSCWLLVTLVIHLLFILSQKKFVKTDTFLYISLSQLRYPDGLKVTFKFVLAAVMIVNVGMVLFVRMCSEIAWLSLTVLDKVLYHEIHCTRWITRNHFNMFPPSVHSEIICPSVCSIYFIKISVLSCILFTLLQIFKCLSSLCVDTQALTHTHTCVYILYLFTYILL